MVKYSIHGTTVFSPDVIGVDKAGNVYIALQDEKKPGIYNYNKDFDLIDIISTPEIPSHLAFGKRERSKHPFYTCRRKFV